jgi:N-methylhydantoinase B
VLYVRWNGGGGVGDPLERSIDMVRDDVLGRTISDEAAREIYGVVLKDGKVEPDATAERRKALRSARAGLEIAQ